MIPFIGRMFLTLGLTAVLILTSLLVFSGDVTDVLASNDIFFFGNEDSGDCEDDREHEPIVYWEDDQGNHHADNPSPPQPDN